MTKMVIGIVTLWALLSAALPMVEVDANGGNLMNQNQASQLDAAER